MRENHLAACRRLTSGGFLLAGSVAVIALLLFLCAAAAAPDNTGVVHVRASRSATSKTTTTPAPQATLKHFSTRSPGLITKTTDAIYRALSGVFTYGSDEMENEGVMAETLNDYLLESTTPPVRLVRLTSTSTTAIPPTTRTPKTTTSTVAAPVLATSTQNSIIPPTTTAKSASTLASVMTRAKLDQTSASTSGPILGSSSSTADEPKSIVSTTTTTKPPSTTTSTTTTTASPTTTTTTLKTTTTKTTTTTSTTTTNASTPEPPTSGTTRKPKRRKKKERATTAEPIELQATNTSSTAEQHSKLYEILADAITAVLPSLGLLNRTTRVAPERELSDFSLESGRLTLDGETFQPATSEDVHLLCKLLHRHLEASNKTATLSTKPVSAPTTTTTTTTTRKPTTTTTPSSMKAAGSTTSKPAEDEVGLFVRDPGELDGTTGQASHLLESWFNFERQNTATRAEGLAQAQSAATEFLLNLYELAAKSAPDRAAAEPASDYENDEEMAPTPDTGHSEVAGKGNQTSEFKLHAWSKTKLNSKGHLRFVYWLLERANATHFRVVEPTEAQQLLERLTRAQVDRQVEASAGGRLRPQHVSLVGPYQESEQSQRGRHKHRHHHHHGKNSDTHKPGDNHSDHHHHEADSEPHVIDDTLVTLGEQPSFTSTTVAPPRGSEPKSSFQIFMDRLGEASFTENLHLYLAIFILALLLIILCFACPMICFKLSRNSKSRALPGAPSSAPATGNARAVRTRTAGQLGPTGRRRGAQRVPPASKESPVPPQPLKGILSGPKGEMGGAGGEPISILSGRQQQHHQGPTAGGEESPDSMWRRLSSTTTTLVRDESHSFRTDGATLATPDLRGSEEAREQGQTGKEGAKRSQFEWYSFEDKLERQEVLKAHGRRPPAPGEEGPGDLRSPRELSVVEQQRLAKSVQAPAEDSARELALPLWLEFRERHEARTSDTLTKSELMLVKEKLVPIARQHQQRQVASQTSEPWDPVYVNQSAAAAAAGEVQKQTTHQAAAGSDDLEQLVSRFIDSSESRSDSNERQSAMVASLESQRQQRAQEQLHSEPQQVDLVAAAERRPKMRLLELPPRSQSRVEAIKAELGKLEQRDQAATRASISRRPSRRSDSSPQRLDDGGTYRRYDL